MLSGVARCWSANVPGCANTRRTRIRPKPTPVPGRQGARPRSGRAPLDRVPLVLGLRGTGHEGGDDVAGVTIEVVAGSVVSGRGAGVRGTGGDLDVPQRHPGIESRRDEAVPQRVR